MGSPLIRLFLFFFPFLTGFLEELLVQHVPLPGPPPKFPQAVTSLSFSCDETYLATLGGQDWRDRVDGKARWLMGELKVRYLSWEKVAVI